MNEIDLDSKVVTGGRDLACHMDSLRTPSRTNTKYEMDLNVRQTLCEVKQMVCDEEKESSDVVDIDSDDDDTGSFEDLYRS